MSDPRSLLCLDPPGREGSAEGTSVSSSRYARPADLDPSISAGREEAPPDAQRLAAGSRLRPRPAAAVAPPALTDPSQDAYRKVRI
jgi:hypothetical protein